MKKLYLFVLAIIALSACGPNNEKDNKGKAPGATVVLPVDTNVIFTLSMLANLPASTFYWDSATAPQYIYNYAQPLIDATLAHPFDTSGGTPNISGWTRVWGPSSTVTNSLMIDAISALSGDTVGPAYVSTVSMTIFRNGSNFVVAIQATNPYSNYAWETLDFNVKTTVPWTTFYPAQNWGSLSQGTYIGLSTLLTLSSNGQTPVQFLDAAVAHAGDTALNFVVTGHSLGGALSPAFALYYKSHINTASNPAVWCFSTAGATPGDSVFAASYNIALANNTIKAWNAYDVVPHAWVPSLLNAIKSTRTVKDYVIVKYEGGIYSTAGNSVFFDSSYSCSGKQKEQPATFKDIPTPGLIDTAIDDAINSSQANNYVHICNGGQQFYGAGNSTPYVDIAPYDPTNPVVLLFGLGKPEYEFVSQLGAEHVAAYTLHYQMKPIHEFVKGLVQQNNASVVNLCKNTKAQKGKRINMTVPKRSVSSYANLMGAMQMKAWGW